jgi:Na+-translocating ferredoxin:NAD+ oxidoreductase RnfA subunit
MATVSQFLIILTVFLIYLIAVSIYLITVKTTDPKHQKYMRTIGWIIMISSILLLIPVAGNISVSYQPNLCKSKLGSMLALVCG